MTFRISFLFKGFIEVRINVIFSTFLVHQNALTQVGIIIHVRYKETDNLAITQFILGIHVDESVTVIFSARIDHLYILKN